MLRTTPDDSLKNMLCICRCNGVNYVLSFEGPVLAYKVNNVTCFPLFHFHGARSSFMGENGLGFWWKV